MARPIDPHREEFELQVLAAASQVFAEMGYRDATTTAIAHRVQLKKSSLYHYFPTKESLLFRTLEANLLTTLAPLERLARQPGEAAARLRQCIRSLVLAGLGAPHLEYLFSVERASLTPEHLATILQLRRRHERLLGELIEQGIADGSLAVPETEVAIKLILGAVNSVPSWWSPQGRLAPEAMADTTTHLLIDRMLARPLRH